MASSPCHQRSLGFMGKGPVGKVWGNRWFPPPERISFVSVDPAPLALPPWFSAVLPWPAAHSDRNNKMIKIDEALRNNISYIEMMMCQKLPQRKRPGCPVCLWGRYRKIWSGTGALNIGSRPRWCVTASFILHPPPLAGCWKQAPPKAEDRDVVCVVPLHNNNEIKSCAASQAVAWL